MVKLPLKDKYEHISPEVKALAERGNVTLEEWRAFRGNSYEQELLYPKLTNEALLELGKQLVVNCQFDKSRPYRSYNEAVMGFLAPELLRRLESERTVWTDWLHRLHDQMGCAVAGSTYEALRAEVFEVAKENYMNLDNQGDRPPSGWKALSLAWEKVYRTRDAYHNHSFTTEWTAYEEAMRALKIVGGPDLLAEKDLES